MSQRGGRKISIKSQVIFEWTLRVEALSIEIISQASLYNGSRSRGSWSPGLNFINILRTAFTLADPKSVKKTVKLSIFFTLLGSTNVKAVRRTLMNLSPGSWSPGSRSRDCRPTRHKRRPKSSRCDWKR